MYERFTDEARRVIVNASADAHLFGHDFIGDEHLLCALFGAEVPMQALDACGVTSDRIRRRIIEVEGERAPIADGRQPPPMTRRGREILELSLREALQLGHSHIGAEHLLLGIVRCGKGRAYDLIAEVVDPSELRKAVIETIIGLGRQAKRQNNGDLDCLAAMLRPPSVLGGNFRENAMAVIEECREWRKGAQDGQPPRAGNDPQAK